MESVRERILAVVAALEARDDLDVRRTDVHWPVPEHMIAAQEAKWGIRFGPRPRAFYRQVNGCDIEWHRRPEAGEYFDGRIQFVTHMQVLGGWDERTPAWSEDLYFDWQTPEQQAPYRVLKPFDYPGFDDSACVGFLEEDGAIDDTLVFSSVDFGYHRLPIGVEDYLDLVLACGGAAFFARFLCPVRPGSGEEQERDRFLARMEEMFPEVDLARFQPPFVPLG